MTATSEPPSVAGVAAGIADADRVGASVTAQAAKPINKSRFILVSPPWIRGIATKREVSIAPRVPRLAISRATSGHSTRLGFWFDIRRKRAEARPRVRFINLGFQGGCLLDQNGSKLRVGG